MLKWLGITLLGLMSIVGGINCWKFDCYFRGTLPVPHFSGIAFIVYGVILVLLGSKRIFIKTKNYDESTICSLCQNVVQTWQAKDNKCPKCGGNIVPLAGFYQRHPELKEPEKTK